MADTLALLIPILAVGGWIIPVTVRSILKSQERQLELKMSAQQAQSDATMQQIAALRREIAELRDTSTGFDMSLQHSVQRLDERLGHMETKAAALRTLPAQTEQQAGLH